MTATTKPAKTGKTTAQPAAKTPSKATKGAFADLGQRLKSMGTQAATVKQTNGGDLAWLDIDLIDVESQQRTDTFDGEDSTIESLSGTILEMEGLLQTILVTPRENGRYLLVAGERRLRALIRNGEKTAPCFIRKLTPSQIKDAQFLENVERQRLSVVETSRAIEDRMNELREQGVEANEITPAILKRYGRQDTPSNRTWLSNLMALKDLGDAGLAAMALTTNTQAVAALARLEKQDPEAAAAVVDQVRQETQDNPGAAGKQLIEKANEEKRQLREKAGKAPRANAKGKAPAKGGQADKAGQGGETSMATPPDHSTREPGNVKVTFPGLGDNTAVTRTHMMTDIADQMRDPEDSPEFGVQVGEGEHAGVATTASEDDEPSFELFEAESQEATHPGAPLLKMVLTDLEAGVEPKEAIASLAKEDADHVRDFLWRFYDAGTKCQHHTAAYVMAGLRRGVFGYSGIYGAQLSAFIHGSQSDNPRFHLLNIIGAMRPTRIEVND